MTSNTILLVDDDADLLQVLSTRCQDLGLAVLRARNLLTATAILNKHAPDVICIDVEMPTGDGLKFCELLDDDPRLQNLPIIVLTGRKDEETIETCLRLGIHYVCKSADAWSTLKPLVEWLVVQSADCQRTRTRVRPRRSPKQLIPLWPEDTDSCPPKNAATETQGGPSTSESAKASVAPRRVLVADDDVDLVAMLIERLNSLGCNAIGVNSSLDAVNAIYRSPPDLVILDVNMPSGNGLSVCEMLSRDESLQGLPVIILTGCADEKTIRRCHDMLVFYVQKNADVWRRIEPLLRELLDLGDPPLEEAVEAKHSSHDGSTKVMQSQSVRIVSDTGGRKTIKLSRPVARGAPAKQLESSALIDTVFAMLGDGERGLQEAESDELPRAAVETPWILSIDDDSDFSDALKARLNEYGIAVSRAADGMAGFWMANTTRAKAILLDYQMPNGQGDYILRRLMENPVTRDIPVIMITGVKDKMLERRMLAMGAKAYFLKPVDFEQLRQALAKFIPMLRREFVRPLPADAR